jgi:hypothetical protein
MFKVFEPFYYYSHLQTMSILIHINKNCSRQPYLLAKLNETKKLYRGPYIQCRCFLPSLAPFGQAVSEEKIFLTVANQKQELPLAAIFVGGTGRNEETL